MHTSLADVYIMKADILWPVNVSAATAR